VSAANPLPAVAEADISKLEALDPDAEGGAVIDGIRKLQPLPLAKAPPRWFESRPIFSVLESLREAIRAAR
jgi:hypothetical protein